jgi:hypothetical protein
MAEGQAAPSASGGIGLRMVKPSEQGDGDGYRAASQGEPPLHATLTSLRVAKRMGAMVTTLGSPRLTIAGGCVLS